MSNNVYYAEWSGRRTGYKYRIEITPADTNAFSAGVPTAISITNGGTYYTTANNVPTQGGDGSGLTLNIKAHPIGSIETYTITNAGSGYTHNDTYDLQVGGNQTATFKVTDVDGFGAVLDGELKLKGTGYAVNDTAVLKGGNEDCTFNIDSILNGEIYEATIHTTGTGYTASNVVNAKQVLGIGYNTSADITITSVTSGANYIELPAAVIKMGSYDVFEFDEIPTGMPKGGILNYEVDLDIINGLGYTELLDAILFPKLSTTSTLTDTLGNTYSKAYDLGTIHTLFIDPNNSGFREVISGIQKLGAESGLSDTSHLLKIEAHDVVKTATEIMQMTDWKVPTYTNLLNRSNYSDTVILDGFPFRRPIQAQNGDNWFIAPMVDFVLGYQSAIGIITTKLLRTSATCNFGGLFSYVSDVVTYYKRDITSNVYARGTALNKNDIYILFAISSDGGKTFNRGYFVSDASDNQTYSGSALRDWLGDSYNTHLLRPYTFAPFNFLGVKIYGMGAGSLIPKNYYAIDTGSFLKWDLKIGENTYNSIEVSAKEKRGEDIDKYVASSGIKSENTKQTSIGVAWDTTGTGNKSNPAFQPRYGTALYNEPALANSNPYTNYLTVHPAPNISLSFDSTGNVSGTDTDTYTGASNTTTYNGRKTNYQLMSICEQQQTGIESIIGKTLIKLFSKIRWSIEVDIGMEYMEGTDTTDDPLFRWLGTNSGFSFDLSNEPYRSYFSGLTNTVPTNWILAKSTLDLDSEVVNARFIQKPT